MHAFGEQQFGYNLCIPAEAPFPVRLLLVDILERMLCGQAGHCLLPYYVRISFACLSGFNNFKRKRLGNRVPAIGEAQVAAGRFKRFSDNKNGFPVERTAFQ
jgi:hypothetical protein